MITEIFKPEGTINDLMDRLEKSDTEFARDTAAKLAKISPISIAVVFELFKKGLNMELKEAIELEYSISHGFIEDSDFFEGVRALLIDKDKNPKW